MSYGEISVHDCPDYNSCLCYCYNRMFQAKHGKPSLNVAQCHMSNIGASTMFNVSCSNIGWLL